MIAAFQMKSIALIYVSSFFLSLLGSLHRPVKFSLWAQYIPRNRLDMYNSLSEASTYSSVITGPLIASFLLTNALTTGAFALDALTFFICAVAFSLIASEQPHTRLEKKQNDDLFEVSTSSFAIESSKNIFLTTLFKC